MKEIRIPQSVWKKCTAHLFQDDGEHVAFFLAEVSQSGGLKFLVRDCILVKKENMECAGLAVEVQLKTLLEIINKANKTKMALIRSHLCRVWLS